MSRDGNYEIIKKKTEFCVSNFKKKAVPEYSEKISVMCLKKNHFVPKKI